MLAALLLAILPATVPADSVALPPYGDLGTLADVLLERVPAVELLEHCEATAADPVDQCRELSDLVADEFEGLQD